MFKKTQKEIRKKDDANEDSINTNKIVSDTINFLNNQKIFETSQETLEIRNMFRGIMIKSWTGNNFDANEDRKHNKIIVKESVLFRTEFQVNRCNA